jgi:hypothetical protein
LPRRLAPDSLRHDAGEGAAGDQHVVGQLRRHAGARTEPDRVGAQQDGEQQPAGRGVAFGTRRARHELVEQGLEPAADHAPQPLDVHADHQIEIGRHGEGRLGELRRRR